LAFHPLPQLIQAVFNRPWFGLPRHVTDASSWSWQDHSASGLPPATARPIKTRFRYGSVPTTLNLAAYDNSPAHYAKGTPSDPKILRLLVSAWFQVLFHSPPGVLFTFPSRYWFTIGSRRIFSLSRWSCWIPARFLVSRGTWEHYRETDSFRVRGYHPLWPDFPDRSAMNQFCNSLKE
jgi:hypothetical protein